MSRLFAISDIHGCFDTFYELVVNHIRLQKSDELVLLGDYIDRGEKTREVIDFIIDLDRSGFSVTSLAGNHESMLLQSLEDPSALPLWLVNSGDTTLESFKIDKINLIENRYLSFFRELKYYHSSGNFLFVHAGFNDLADDPFSDIHGMIWETNPVYKHELLKNRIIIHGHRPKTPGYVKEMLASRSMVIPIDTGCVYTNRSDLGYLSALDVLNMKLISVRNIEKS